MIVPFYDQSQKYIIGVSGRSTNGYLPKWRNNDEFNRRENLYNWWNAQERIKESKVVFLTESITDAIKLIDCGINNVLAFMGANISDEQLIKIECSSAENLIILRHDDEAGKLFVKNIQGKCGRLYNIKVPDISKKDIAELSNSQVLTLLEKYDG